MVDEKQCLFCRIVSGEIPCKKVYEDSNTFAFLDINPKNPGHTLVIPKKHFETLLEMTDRDAATLFQSVKKVAEMAMSGMKAQGISLSLSNGKAAGQVVAHAHFHVIPRFLNEGPVGLESMLPQKKMTDEMMNQIAKAIAAAPEAEKRQEAQFSLGAPAAKKEKRPAKPSDEDEDFEDIEELEF